jgi:hypothetical protein
MELHDIFFLQFRSLEQRVSGTMDERDGLAAWPVSNPDDVITLDFYFCGHLMCTRCGTEVSDIQDLQKRIQNGYEVTRRAPGLLQRVRQSLFNALG